MKREREKGASSKVTTTSHTVKSSQEGCWRSRCRHGSGAGGAGRDPESSPVPGVGGSVSVSRRAVEIKARREKREERQGGGRRQTTDDRRQTTDDKRQTTSDRRQTIRDGIAGSERPLTEAGRSLQILVRRKTPQKNSISLLKTLRCRPPGPLVRVAGSLLDERCVRSSEAGISISRAPHARP